MLLERFDPFLAEFDRLANRALGTDGAGMPMDVVRQGDELIVRFDLPGVSSDKISLTAENHTLTVSAERHAGYGEREQQVLIQERFDGTMTRRLRIPDWVDAERVSADYTDGVLTIRLPLAEQAKPRRIEVRTGSAGQAQISS